MEHSEICNSAVLSGIVNTIPKYSHDIYGEKFYTFELAVKRKSGVYDHLPVMFSDRICTADSVRIGDNLAIEGQYRSYNNFHSEGNRLLLYVFVQNLSWENGQPAVFFNSLVLKGYICKPVIYRKTPLGREISDLLLAVNRSFQKSDYIPCITWGRNARYASTLGVGSRLSIEGRIQSREYTKATPEGTVKRTAYEVSVIKLECQEPVLPG